MKKFISGFFLLLSLGFCVNNTNAANILKEAKNTINTVKEVKNKAENTIESVNNTINTIKGGVNSINGIVGGISQTTADLKGTVNLGAGIVDDFEDMWDTINGGGVGPDGKFELPDNEEFNEIGKNTTARGFILNVLNFVLSFLGIIAVGIVIYAGFSYVISMGDDGKIESAKKMIIYSVIGIIIILGSFAIINTVIKNAGTGGDGRETEQSVDGEENQTSPGGGNTNEEDDPNETNNLFNFNNGITISGQGVQNFNKNSIVSLQNAITGVDFGLTVQANAQIDFGDNTFGALDTISQPNSVITHSYGEKGNYVVRAIVQTVDGKIYTFQKTLFVGGIDVKITASKQLGIVNDPITLNASYSKLSIGTAKTYTWTCGGGPGCFPAAQGKIISVTFSEPGNYVVNLEIENTIGIKDQNSINIDIAKDEPVAEFSIFSTNNSKKPGEYRFDASQSTNIFGENGPLTYEWSFDGITKTFTSPQWTYEFKTTGARTIELKVIQNYNGQKLVSEKVSEFLDVPTVTPLDFNVSQE